MVSDRLFALGIGYLFGCFLTAELVAILFAGKRAAQVGSTGGNPGMANIMAHLGFVPGILTLAGDLGKTLLSSFIAYRCFGEAGWIIVLYAGLGCTLGHDFPFWRVFRGGKGVATTSMAIVLYHFPLGLLSNILGMLVVFGTKYLCIGGPVIPLSFAGMMFARGDREAGVLGLVLSALSVYSHGSKLLGIRKGRTERTDVLGAIRRKLRKAA